MSASWWIGSQVNARSSMGIRQKKEEVPNTAIGIGNGKQPSAIVVILDN
jgi:hypothetical protein